VFEAILSFLPRAIAQGVPLLYGSTGEIITQKSGNMNLGIPGVMYVGGICGVIGALSAPLTCLFTEKVFKADFGKEKLITVIYTGILTLTTGVSLGIAIENNFDASSLVRFIGMVLFLGSDAVLAKVYFCEGQNTRVNVVINHALYYSAQFALATSLYLF
jgi:ABC-type uncharacterized transport system permease subunit